MRCSLSRPGRGSSSGARSTVQRRAPARGVVACRAGQPGGGGWLQAAVQLLQSVLGGDAQDPARAAPGGSKGAPAGVISVLPEQEEGEALSEEYTEAMQARMGTSLTYRHEDGINYNFVLPDLIVGSCLQGPADVDRLAAEAGVTTVFSLQEDCDMEYFGIDVAAIQARCKEVGVAHVRFPVRDFDPFDLRLKLPKAVARLAKAHNPRHGVAYIHCTAGLGRAPATALAYMYWLRGWQLPEALQALTSVRTCSPRIESIRAATADLLTDSKPMDVTVGIRRRGTATKAQVAGLDVGWHTLLDLRENPDTHRLEVTRSLLPGSYPFKFILDGTWCANHDYPTYADGANTNNILTVLPRDAADNALRERLLDPAGELREAEREQLAGVISVLPEQEEGEALSEEYTEAMQARMGTSLTYRHEDGINYNFVLPDLIVGSCLQGPADVDRLAAEAGVTTVFSLQEDCDMEYFGIDVAAIQARCKEVGVAHVRFPVRDFDPFDLRLKLPKAVARLAKAHNPRHGVAYIHCTAGLGRAPATALAYMYWLRGWQLPEALQALTSVRTCSPRIESIRAATADLLTDSKPMDVTVGIRRRGTATKAQVAGLDVGWHTLLDLRENPDTHRLEVTRSLLPGSYPFKFILDGTWCANHDYPTYADGANTNNILTVLPRDAADNALRERLLDPAGKLRPEERLLLSNHLCPWSTHDVRLHLPGDAPEPEEQAAAPVASGRAGEEGSS
ncbi:DSP4 [Scenedesmus sp. PABB004]|nr:DSP4 [Scenedesmus sp. PABB004]